MLKRRKKLISKILMLTICTSFLSNTTLFSGITNIVYASSATTAQTSELSQKGKNIQTMLNTSPDNCYTYWNYFADSNRYPYYIYLDNYYSGKDTLPLLKGTASFFRVNIAPSLIDMGDKIYNNDGLLDQSQLRAKEILISMIKEKGKDIFNNEEIDQQLDMSKDLIESFDNFIEADKELYNKLFDGRYEKLEASNQKIEKYLKSKAKEGVNLTPKVLIQSEEFIEISKNTNMMDLLGKFDKEMANIYKVSNLLGKFDKGLEGVSCLKDASDEYFEMRKVLQANNDFINFLEVLQNNASEKAVREAAKDLKETYQNNLKGQLQAIGKLGLGEAESYIKGLSWQVSVTNLGMNAAFKVGDKVDKFDRLRLASNMAVALDKVMSDDISQYNATYDTNEKNKIADSIYKYAPYLFALRSEGENNLYEYLKLIGADKNEIEINKNIDSSRIQAIYNVLYQNINLSSIGEITTEVYKNKITMNNQTAFNANDFIINNINLERIDNKYFISILGKPVSVKVEEGPPCEMEHYVYPNVKVSFADNSFLHYIEICDTKIKGPRNTIIGDDIYEVISKFKCNSNTIDNNIRYLYCDNSNNHNQFAGWITYEDGKIKTLQYYTEYWNWHIVYEVKDDRVTKISLFRLPD